MIKAVGLTKTFGDKKLFENLTFELKSTGLYVINGVSGIGKTTLLRIISSLEESDSGSLEVKGKISYVFQENRLFPWLSLEKNISLTAVSHEKCTEMLNYLGLYKDRNLLPAQMSGGMQRRAEIARAFSSDYDIMLIDEPYSGLDESNIKLVASLIEKIAKEKCVILVSHDHLELLREPDGIIKI